MAGAKQISLNYLLLFVNTVFQLTHGAEKLPNVQCNQPVPTVVAVDPPRHRFRPYFVSLHRCQGSVDNFSPNVKVCRATSYRNVQLQAFSMEKMRHYVVTVRNHTSCGSECAHEASLLECDLRVQEWNEDKCECVCKFRDGPPPEHIIARKEGFRWNPHSCRYECNRSPDFCSAKKVWNREQCSCICRNIFKRFCTKKNKIIDSDTCGCKDGDHAQHGKRLGFFSHSMALVLVVLLVVAVLVIILLLGVLCYRRKTTPRCMKHAESQTSEITETPVETVAGFESPSTPVVCVTCV